MAITDWPEDERPRERLLARGAGSLSDAELLAIFLRVGVRGKSAVDLARILLERFGSLNRLFAATQAEVAAVPGLAGREAWLCGPPGLNTAASRALREAGVPAEAIHFESFEFR